MNEQLLKILHETVGVLHYLFLWGTLSVGVASLALVYWCNDRRREALREASRRSTESPGLYFALGLGAAGVPLVVTFVLLHAVPPLGVALLIAIALGLLLPGLTVAALRLGASLSRQAGRDEESLGSLASGLAVLQGAGFLYVLGLFPWAYWVLSGTGAVAVAAGGDRVRRAAHALTSPAPAPDGCGNAAKPAPEGCCGGAPSGEGPGKA